MRRSGALLVVLAMLAACSDDGAEDTTTTTSQAPSATSQPDTTTTAERVASTTAAPPTTATTSDPFAAEGSGCTPGPGALPDGEWYGGVREFDDERLGFDLACFYIGDAATAAAAEDGEESPPPNDYYVRNENEQVRELTVGADTPVIWYPSGDPNDQVDGTYAEWIAYLATRESYLAVWMTIEDGSVTTIEEQWVP